MIHQKMKLSDTTKATMTTYILDDGEYERKGLKKPAVIICPGGGYTMVSKNEGEPVALFFNRHGYHAFVIDYSVKIDNPFPTALCELARAVSIVKEKKEEWRIQDGISVVGFSAGGNLALSLAIYANTPVITSDIGLSYESVKPERIILGYPAVTLHPKREDTKIPDELIKLMDMELMPDFRGPSIREILIGHENISDKEAESLNLLKYLHKDLPPVFIWGSYTDSIIPATDLTMLASRLYELGVPCELHLFGSGSHGLSLCDTTVKAEEEILGLSMNYWTALCLKWLDQK
jgi:acetyl esterase/lipase